MSAIRKDPPKPVKAPLFKWKDGVDYVCTMSKSPGYAVGEVYTTYTNDKGWVCLKGRDGFEDICTMLVSSFKEV